MDLSGENQVLRDQYGAYSVLHAATLRSPDLRGGVALVIAALATEGRTEITNAATVGRGYEHLEAKFRAIGADIRVFG